MKIVLIMLSSVLAIATHAQKNVSANDSLLIGTWKGTSICQVKSSPCHDEIAVYHITRGAEPNTFHMQMNKMVNGKEEEMGPLDYNFDATKQTLSCQDHQYNTVWNFKVSNNRMEGTLTSNHQLYRIIKLTKADAQ